MPQQMARIHDRRSRRRLRRLHHLMAQTVLGLAILYSGAANAQRTDRIEVRVGIGTFLSHDRGWNFSEPIEFLAGVARTTGSVQLEAGASFSKSFARFTKPAVSPSPPSAYYDGFRLRMGIRAPSPTLSAISALLGAELIVNQTEGEVRAATLGAVVGADINFGPARRAVMDLKYVRFAQNLGSSRGILPLTFSWRL